MLTEDHPLLRNEYQLVTPDIERLCRTLRLMVMTSICGAVIHGHTRFGKSSAIDYLEANLARIIDRRCTMVVAEWNTTNKPTDTRFYERILSALGQSKKARETATDLENRLVEALYCLSLHADARHCFLFIDEAQKLVPEEYGWLVVLYNRLKRRKILLYVMLVGQPSLKDDIELLKKTLDLQVIGRFMRTEIPFTGVTSPETLSSLLVQYDEQAFYPTDSGVSFTQAALPKAFQNKWRLQQLADRIWNGFHEIKRTRGLDSEVGMSMTTLHAIVACILLDNQGRDAEDLVLSEQELNDYISMVVEHHV